MLPLIPVPPSDLSPEKQISSSPKRLHSFISEATSFEKPDLWQTLSETKQPILLYGMGDGADKLLFHMKRLQIPCAGVFASDEFVRGQVFHGFPVMTLSQAETIFSDFTVLLAFSTRLPSVIEKILAIAKRHRLLVPDLPVSGEEIFDAAFYLSHRVELDEARKLFSDETSRRLFDLVIKSKLYGDAETMLAETESYEKQLALFPTDTFTSVFDAGAYTGDTVRLWCSHFPHLRRVYAVEPDRRSFRKLSEFAKESDFPEIKTMCAAVSDREGQVAFFGKGSRSSALQGGLSNAKVVMTDTVTVDGLCEEDEVSFLKFDVEGEEAKALSGAEKTLCRCRPSILLSLYHRPRDLFDLPLRVHSICPGYRFYLRRVRCLPVWELNLLAIPEENDNK